MLLQQVAKRPARDAQQASRFAPVVPRACQGLPMLASGEEADDPHGVSAVVDPWGGIRTRMPFFERTWRDVNVPVYKEKSLTPYTRFGDWLPQCEIALVLIALVMNVLPKKKRSSVDDLLLLSHRDAITADGACRLKTNTEAAVSTTPKTALLALMSPP